MATDIRSTLVHAVTEAMYFTYSSTAQPKLLKTLQQLHKHLGNMSDTERSMFVTEHQKQCAQLYSLLLQPDSTTKKRDPHLVSFHDRIFKTLLNFNPRGPVDVPDIFANFIRGITYFSDEEDIHVRPIYHRLYSCGERGDTMYDELHKCSDTQPPEERRAAEERIYKCLVERMIFDDIYKHNTMFFPQMGTAVHGQNIQHQQRLHQTSEDFKTCFPNMEIKIHIDYVQTIPRVLTIVKKIRGRISYVEVYTKEDIEDKKSSFTKCIVTKSSGVYLRINSFNSIGRLCKLKDNDIHFTTLPEAYNESMPNHFGITK
jgi:hypothetical protein